MKYLETLPLTIKKKWFDEIITGEKTEEYREVKSYWIKRLTNQNIDGSVNGKSFYKHFRYVKFSNGYAKNAPSITLEFKGIEIKTIKHEFYSNQELDVFAIKLGSIVRFSNNRG